MKLLFLFIIFTLILTLEKKSYALTASNSGVTGLWEYPTAEMPNDGNGRFGYTKATPYQSYFLDLAWLPWLEINARFNTFNSVYVGGDRRWRRDMDKAIDLKAILWHSKDPEKWIIPSIAIGIMDIMGTELMKAHYVAATWRWGRFAATMGWGSDRLNGFYGGFEWDISHWLTFKAEYSPLDYKRDKVGSRPILPAKDLPSEKYNIGFVFKTGWGMEGSISYQRGNEWVFGISQRLNLRGPYIGNYRKNYEVPGDARIPCWDNLDNDILISKIKSGIEKYVRVRDVDVKIESSEKNHKLYIAYENYGYSSHAEAMTRMLVLLASVMPEIDELILMHKNAGVPIVKASFPGSLLFDIRSRSLRDKEPMKMAIFSWVSSADVIQNPDAESLLEYKAKHKVNAMVVYEPRIDQTLSHKAYEDRWSIDLLYRGRYSNGWQAIVDIRFPIFNNINTDDRVGIWWEKDLNDKIRLQQAGFTYANKFTQSGRAWFFADAGWFDEEWFGTNAWTRYYADDGKWWIGARVAFFHDRDPYSFAGLTDGIYRYYYGRTYDIPTNKDWYYTGWIQGGYHLTDYDIDINAAWGRFVDNDKGYKVEINRHWDDTTIGFWVIDAGRHRPGKDYSRAGVHLEIPAEKWFGTLFGQSSEHIWEQNTIMQTGYRMQSAREGGAIRTPERMMNQLRPVAMKKNVEMLLRDYCSYEDQEKENSKTVTSLFEYIFK